MPLCCGENLWIVGAEAMQSYPPYQTGFNRQGAALLHVSNLS